MKNNGKADVTIKFVDKALTRLSQLADLDNPQQVKQAIANLPTSEDIDEKKLANLIETINKKAICKQC